MTETDIIKKAEELEDLMILMADFDNATPLLEQYKSYIIMLANTNYPYYQAIRFSDICNTIAGRLPAVSNEIFEQYVTYLTLLAICLE